MAKDKHKKKKHDDAGDEAVNGPVNGTGDGTTAAADGRPSLKGKEYDKQLRKLQVELCHLQTWVKAKGLRVIVLFEGRDGAGKGGTIKAITERLSPRVFRIAALPAPSDRQKSQMYMQRYMEHFPGAGEVVLFDRSWYNRAGVEPVMGFCTKEQHEKFLQRCPEFERYVVDGGVILIKFWLEVSNKEQEKRFLARITDPVRQWKLSSMDLPSREKWYEYSRARDRMLEATDTGFAPWVIVRSNDKKRARLNAIAHLLSVIPYKKLKREKIELPKRAKKHAYDDEATIKDRRFVREVF
jgi:polyphosphate kinase